MLKRVTSYFFGSIVMVSLFAGNVFACACCAEPGTRVLYSAKTDTFVRDLVKEFKFAQKADLFTTEAGFEIIKGLAPIQKEDEAAPGILEFTSAGVLSGKSWQITLKSPKALAATYSFAEPLKYSEFKVDIHDRTEMPLGPWLYKELRFEGLLTSASGFAKAGAVRGTKYSLVFQGRGNGCNEVEDFTHWRMDIDGPKAGYAFFGRLSSGRKDPNGHATSMLDTRH